MKTPKLILRLSLLNSMTNIDSSNPQRILLLRLVLLMDQIYSYSWLLFKTNCEPLRRNMLL